MKYNVKLTDEAISQIWEKIGIKNGCLNLKKGILVVRSQNEVDAIGTLYDIDNVNMKPYSNSEQQPNEMSLEERRHIIGKKVQVGSIVRVKIDDTVQHIVIVSVEGSWYEGAKIILTSEGYDPENEVLIKKGDDVIYRNLTYKNKVRVLNDTICGLKEENFICEAGKITGRIVNEATMERIIDLVKRRKGESVPEMKKETTQKTFEEVVQEVTSLDELVKALNLSDGFLKNAICISVSAGNSNMKKLLPVLQRENLSERLSQNAIKNVLTQEFCAWQEKENASMKDCCVSYFLKVIVKKLKNA